MNVIYRETVISRFGWRLRIYLGGTSKRTRFRKWDSGLSQGVYLRLCGEQVVGVQWRRTA